MDETIAAAASLRPDVATHFQLGLNTDDARHNGHLVRVIG
jgi:hypothetical protein